MNKEEIEELKDFTIDLTDIDELALGLEVCSKKSNMVIQEFADTIIQLQQENQELHKHLEVPEPCSLKTLEDYKSYYEDTTKEQILADTYIDYCAYVNLAHRYAELKKQLEEYKYSHSCSFVDTCKNVTIANYNQQKEFIDYLENEKDRLIHEVSHYYTDSFDRQHVVNEDVYDEVDKILNKFKEIIGGIK